MNDFGDRKRHLITIGGVHVSHVPTVIHTVLGSCISVCLRDPVTKIGGMNHFMLPSAPGEQAETSRFGVHAMELLINGCMSRGADRSRLEAKVFGGGHVLKTRLTPDSVSHRNIEFALEFLQMESIPVVAKNTGGLAARSVFFFTDTGKVLVRTLSPTGEDVQKLMTQEKTVTVQPQRKPAADVVLF